MVQTKNKELEDFIASLIGGRPIERSYGFNGLCAYYFCDILEEGKQNNLEKAIMSKLYFPVLAEKIDPTYQHTLTGALDVVLEDCFGSEAVSLMIEEMEFRELIGCNEEKLVIANYSAGIKFKSKLIQSLNMLFARIENARKNDLVQDNQYHTTDHGY